MIKINLIPSDGGKRKAAAPGRSSSGPSPAPFYLLLALLYAGVAVGGYFAYSSAAAAAAKVKQATAKRDKQKAEVERRRAEFEANNLLSQEIEEKYAVVAALGPENRVFWSEKINMLGKARLNLAIYLTKIELQEKIDEKETDESVRRREEWKRAKEKDPKLTTPEPQPVKQPVINQTLLINGIAYGNESPQRLAQIRLFMENLRKLEWARESGETARFLDRMAPEIVIADQKIDTVAGVEVIRFGLSIKANPQLDRTMSTDDKDGAAPGGAAKAGDKPAAGNTTTKEAAK